MFVSCEVRTAKSPARAGHWLSGGDRLDLPVPGGKGLPEGAQGTEVPELPGLAAIAGAPGLVLRGPPQEPDVPGVHLPAFLREGDGGRVPRPELGVDRAG